MGSVTLRNIDGKKPYTQFKDPPPLLAQLGKQMGAQVLAGLTGVVVVVGKNKSIVSRKLGNSYLLMVSGYAVCSLQGFALVFQVFRCIRVT